MRIFVFLVAILFAAQSVARAAEPFFKPGDVVALVGGEDMVVAAELGYLETLIQLALPDHKLKFRSLAREGDTVFEQRRDLNYPSLEAQLDKMGATVVICQFGQMESLMAGAAADRIDRADAIDKVPAPSGASAVNAVNTVNTVPEKAEAARKAKVAEFVAAYEKLIGRLRSGKRRIAIGHTYRMGAAPDGSFPVDPGLHYETVGRMNREIGALAEKTGSRLMYFNGTVKSSPEFRDYLADGFRLNKAAQVFRAADFAKEVRWTSLSDIGFPDGIIVGSPTDKLRTLIAAKNRLWFHYYRPQNWAFLAGDRTNQPSSRDHLDPSKRWFPEELEKFVPLIDAKDAEIWALAKKLSAEGGK